MNARRLPWVTAALGLASAAVFLLPGAGDVFVFDRAAILEGQVWRLWTGHAVHFTAAHLLWNLVVVLAAGSWLERLAPRPARWFYAFAPPLIAGALLAFDSALARYGGLSGVGAGLLVLLALTQMSSAGERRALWIAVLVLTALKIALETWTATPLLAAGVRSVPLAHVAGAVGGVAVFFTTRGRGFAKKRA